MEEKKVILMDTREQEGKHNNVLEYFEKNNYKVVRSKLFVGDYTYLSDMRICVDTKKDIQEIVGNVTSQHDRFIREIQRANENGIKLVFLIQDEYIGKLEELNRWYNPRLKVSPRATKGTTLYKILYRIEKEYGTKFYMTTRAKCGENIIKILNGEMES